MSLHQHFKLWMRPQDTLEASLTQEEMWAKKSIAYLRTGIPQEPKPQITTMKNGQLFRLFSDLPAFFCLGTLWHQALKSASAPLCFSDFFL